MENGSISQRRDEKGVEKRGKNRRTGLFYDSHGRTIADSFVTFGEEFSQEGQEVAGVKRSSRIFAKRCLHYRLLPLSKRPSSRYYIVSKRICNRHLPSFGLRFQMLKPARQNGSPSLRFPPPSFPRPRIKNESFFFPLPLSSVILILENPIFYRQITKVFSQFPYLSFPTYNEELSLLSLMTRVTSMMEKKHYSPLQSLLSSKRRRKLSSKVKSFSLNRGLVSEQRDSSFKE